MRPVHALALTLAPLALSACCSTTWRPHDEAALIIAETNPAPVDLTLEWRHCDMSASAGAQMNRAALILDDEAAALVDYHSRIARAVTPEERQALTEKRIHRLEHMIAQVDQLRHVVGLAQQQGSASSIAVVFTSDTPAAAPRGAAPAHVDLELDHVAILGPREVPHGPSYRGASLRLALVALVDVMEAQADEEGILRPETKEEMAKQ